MATHKYINSTTWSSDDDQKYCMELGFDNRKLAERNPIKGKGGKGAFFKFSLAVVAWLSSIYSRPIRNLDYIAVEAIEMRRDNRD